MPSPRKQDQSPYLLSQWLQTYIPRPALSMRKLLERGFLQKKIREPQPMVFPIDDTTANVRRAMFFNGRTNPYGGGGTTEPPDSSNTFDTPSPSMSGTPGSLTASGSQPSASNPASPSTSYTGSVPESSVFASESSNPQAESFDPSGSYDLSCNEAGSCVFSSGVPIYHNCSGSSAIGCTPTNGSAVLCGMACTLDCQGYDCTNCCDGSEFPICGTHYRICCYDDDTWIAHPGFCCACVIKG